MSYFDEYNEQLLFDYSVFQPRQFDSLQLAGNTRANRSDFLDAVEEGFDFRFDFDHQIHKADKLDYEVAAASGFITAVLDILWVEELSLTKAREWGTKEVEKIVIDVAKKKAKFDPSGLDKNDILQKAIIKLEKAFPIPADILSPKFGDGKFHHIRDFVHHPTILGLFFSILSQFTECGFGTDVDGVFKIYKIPKEKLKENLIGNTFKEKIQYGTINWAIHLISDIDGSKDNPGKGTGIPGPILSFFKEMSSLPLINELQIEYRGKDLKISAVLQKIFDGTLFAEHDENDRIIKGTEKPFDFRTELGIMKELVKSTIPVIANECIVRAFYFIRRLFKEIKNNDIKDLSDIAKLNSKNFLPYNSRSLTRMLTVSSGTFMMIVTAKDAVAAAIKCKGDKKKFATYFFLNINYVGIMRFTFACKNDAGYIAEDVKEEYRKFIAEKRKKTVESNKEIPGLKSLMLDKIQTRILYSLKWHKVNYDILQTEGSVFVAGKSQWLEEWERSVLIEFNESDEFIIKNEMNLYAKLKREQLEEDTNAWLYLIAMELDLFIPYYLLDVHQKIDKSVKLKSDYVIDVFCEKQDIVTERDVKRLKQTYSTVRADLTNKKAKTAIGATAAAAVTAATGGLALAFAPEIAVALVGGSFAGLSGAALTSASLAAIGFGSLATGGLGMAGGAAIIAGGGTLLGAVSSGAMTLSVKAFLSSKGTVLNECIKLLTFSREVMLKKYCDRDTVAKIQQTVDNNLKAIETIIENAKIEEDKEDKEDAKLQKKLFDEAKTSIKYIKRCNELLLTELQNKEMIVLAETVSKLRQEHPFSLVWGRFEYKGDVVFIVSNDKPGGILNMAPRSLWYSVNMKTSMINSFKYNPFFTKDADKILRAMDKTLILMDITQSEYNYGRNNHTF